MKLSILLPPAIALIALLACQPAEAGQPVPNNAPHGIPTSAEFASPHEPVPQIAEAWASAWNRCDASAMAALFTDDGIYDDNAFQARSEGTAGIRTWVALTCDHLVNAHAQIIDAFQTRDRVAIRWIFSGAPGKNSPMPVTGKTFSVPVLTVLEMDGGHIKYDGDYYNLADLFRQLGIPAGPWVPPTP